jgi:hypothetical protein
MGNLRSGGSGNSQGSGAEPEAQLRPSLVTGDLAVAIGAFAMELFGLGSGRAPGDLVGITLPRRDRKSNFHACGDI